MGPVRASYGFFFAGAFFVGVFFTGALFVVAFFVVGDFAFVDSAGNDDFSRAATVVFRDDDFEDEPFDAIRVLPDRGAVPFTSSVCPGSTMSRFSRFSRFRFATVVPLRRAISPMLSPRFTT